MNSAPFIIDRVDAKPEDVDDSGMITACGVGMATQADGYLDDLKEFTAGTT